MEQILKELSCIYIYMYMKKVITYENLEESVRLVAIS
jgi:hypothetical protein